MTDSGGRGDLRSSKKDEEKSQVGKSSEPHELTAAVRMAAHHEGQKTVRLAIVCGTIVLGIGIVVWGVVTIATASILWQALSVGGALIGAGGLPFWVYRRARGKFKLTMENEAGRVTKLELEADAERTSSELQTDGNNQPEDLI